MRDYDLPPRVDDDPRGSDRGQRDPFAYELEMREWDELVAEHGLGCWECEQVKTWLKGG